MVCFSMYNVAEYILSGLLILYAYCRYYLFIRFASPTTYLYLHRFNGTDLCQQNTALLL